MRCNNSVSLSSSSITNRPRSSDLCTTRNTVLVKDWARRHHHAKKSIHKEKMIVLEPPSNQQWHVQCLDRPISHPHSSGTLSRAIKQGNMWKIMKRKIHTANQVTQAILQFFKPTTQSQEKQHFLNHYICEALGLIDYLALWNTYKI